MRHLGGRRPLALRTFTCLLSAAGAVLASWSAGAAPARAATPSPLPARFTVVGTQRAIPRSFFGLSVEYKELASYQQEGPVFDRAISLMKPEDGGRMILRIGGKSADHVYWEATKAATPPWVSYITTQWLDRLSQLVARDRLRVMLDLNLAVHSPQLESLFATAAAHTLPAGSLAGLEIGNEPDLYWRQPQLQKQRIPSTKVRSNWSNEYSPADYRRDYVSYAQVLASQLRGIPLGAPEIISSKPPWLGAAEALGNLTPAFLSIHRYASSTCWPPTSPWYPTLGTLLNDARSDGLARTVTGAVAFAHAHHQALRLTEVNSISCGGNAGVANSFAAALWAPDALFAMIRAGVDGVSWHLRPSTFNAPFLAGASSISPLPELYGLAAFAQMTRPGAQLLASTVAASPALHVKGWAVGFPSAIRVLLLNKGPRPASVTVNLGLTGHAAYLKRLLAPGISATSGVTFGGQMIGSDGRWHGRLQAPAVAPHGKSYSVALPGYSAAMLTVWL